MVNVFGPSGNNLPSTLPTYVNGRKWVDLGKSNTFPEYCMAVIANCAPLAASAQLMQRFLTGLRYEPLDKDGNVVEKALLDYLSWFEVDTENGRSASEKEFRSRVMSDIAHLSALSIDVSPTRGQNAGVDTGRKIAALFHRDVMRLRVGMPDATTGKVSTHYWSANWEKCKSTRYKPIELPVFNPSDPGAEKVANIYKGHFTSGMDLYYLPRWIGALADAETWASIPVHNKVQADAGFSVRTLIVLPGNKDQVDLDQVDQDIESTFTGPNGKPYMVLLKGNTGDKPDVITLNRGDQPGESEGLRDKATEHILTGYGMPKLLLGMDAKTGMGGAGMAIEETWNHFLNTTVLPQQELFTDVIDTLLRLNGHTEVVQGRIVNQAPWSFTDKEQKRQEYMATTRVNDALLAAGKPELPADDMRGNMMLAEIGQTKNIPAVVESIAQTDPSTPTANA